MSKISKLIAGILLFASLFTVSVNSYAANNRSSTTLEESASAEISSQSTQVTSLPNGKKQLKKKLSLDYTNPTFETELSQNQKEAILTALKKWKGELPIDNTFTVTSIAELKTDTPETTSKVKKSKKDTPTAQVVYMWARSVNPNWPAGRIPTGEESEEGDPRYVRTEFNVLLKTTKNGKYKASIERDTEVKTESVEVTENPLDIQIYKDLFGTDKADNAFTATQDILIDAVEQSSVSSSSISSVNSSLVISSAVYNSSVAISSPNPISLITNQSSLAVSSKKVGFLESILSFGSVKASAGEFDYSWPWKNGETWRNGQSWHQCVPIVNNFTTYGCSLDFQPHFTNASSDVVAPISGTIKKACDDGVQGYMQIGNMSILHLASNSLIYNNVGGVYVTKSSKIGTVYPNAIPENSIYNQCGSSSGRHLHLKFSPIFETYANSGVYGGNMPAIDGTPINGWTN